MSNAYIVSIILFLFILFFFAGLVTMRMFLWWRYRKKDKEEVAATNNLSAAREALIEWIFNNRGKTIKHPEAQMLLRAELVTAVEFYKHHPSCEMMEDYIKNLRKAIKATP